jgi:hypothetical protein
MVQRDILRYCKKGRKLGRRERKLVMRKGITVRLNNSRQAKLEFLKAHFEAEGYNPSDKDVLVAALDLMYEVICERHTEPLQGNTSSGTGESAEGG